ncbi:MAG: AAA family ATPase, partial [Actinophytocola sp.]|nr:AAA family ATPase [Actinophytocola sp.]
MKVLLVPQRPTRRPTVKARRPYVPRVLDTLIQADLTSAGAVVIEGPKACGKTETARQHAASEIRLDVDETATELVRISPQLVLDGATPRLLDEWQIEPRIWNVVRRAVDDRQETGQFLLTGSATPQPDARRHSGAGRMARVRMRPMSLWESGESTGDVSLAGLFDGTPAQGRTEVALPDYADLIVRGGWPELVVKKAARPERFVRSYIENVIEHAIPATMGTRYDPFRLQRFL